MFHQTVEVFLILVLCRLFTPVSQPLARQMAVLGLIPIPIVFLNVVNELAAQVLTSGASFLAVLSQPGLDALALLFLHLHGQGLQVAAIFWGLWLFPLGLLILRCRRSFLRSGLLSRCMSHFEMESPVNGTYAVHGPDHL